MDQSWYPSHPVLLVDDEAHALASFDIALRSNGINNTIRCQESRKVMAILEEQEIETILLDLMMPHVPGQQILAEVMRNHPHIPVIIVSGVNEIETAVQCMQNGAFDYVLKPAEADRLLPSIRRALEVRHLRRENSRLSQRFFSDTLTNPQVFDAIGIITRNGRMKTVFKYCEAIAEGMQPVLITGETGSGKEQIARALHALSGRQGEFVAVNVAGLDDHVFSDTLFGHAKGAFTGADRLRAGLIEKAAGGTLFLDEIGDLSESSQVKLLRFLEEREYYPLGSDVAKKSNTRVLVATHQNLEAAIEAGHFRKDLYFRLHTHHVTIPPLRERKDDIPLLLDHFLAEAAKEFNKKKPTYHPELITLLKEYHYPGNIREFKAMVFDALSSHTSRMLSGNAFKFAIERGKKTADAQAAPAENHAAGPWLAQLEPLPTIKEMTRTLINEALRRSKDNQRVAALMLGITPQALNQRLKRS